MHLTGIASAIGGLLIVAIALRDVFQGVIVPRAENTVLRLSRLLNRFTWKFWPRIAYRLYRSPDARENFLGAYAPFMLVVYLVMWVALLIVGWGLFFFGIREQLHPADLSFWQCVYFAGASFLTIGYGDIVGTTTFTHMMSLVAAACGLAVVAVVATFLFSIFGSFQRRESFVVTVGARAGIPPSGVGLLCEAADGGMIADLATVFREGQKWTAEVMESHLAYPILTFFRSSHDYESWVGTLGVLMDSAALVLTTADVDAAIRGQAHVTYNLGRHLTHDFMNYFGFSARERGPGIERTEFDSACSHLREAGFTVRDGDETWKRFADLRATYAVQLNALARWLEIPPIQWVGDRTLIQAHPPPPRV